MHNHFVHILLWLLPGIWIAAGLISVGLFLFTDMTFNKQVNQNFAISQLAFFGFTVTSFNFRTSDWFTGALLLAALVALIVGLWIKGSYEIENWRATNRT